jgi:hypothetical protein
VLQYTPSEQANHVTPEYMYLVEKILINDNDESFAIAINNKILAFNYDVFDEHSFESVYTQLLDKHSNILLEPIILNLAKNQYSPNLSYRLKEVLGSGFGFGEGVLFKRDYNVLNTILDKHGVTVARLYASMCPLFSDDDQHFSNWVMILLDKFGKDKEVLLNISCNLGSFAWCGSVIPLFDKQLKCFNAIKNHKCAEVCTWVKKNIKDLTSQRRDEEIREDFMTHLYR